ncbi:MAG: DUF3040 domain-containing protein [Acidobacteria bacterium]|nr:DUF3040 domain-containing protein [Acidobacteriota bacterium]
MPLSEHEQRLLDALEQQLHADDPKFAHTLASDPARSFSTRHMIIGILISLAGILILLLGVAMANVFIGVAGFVVMGTGVYFATLRKRTPQGRKNATGGTALKPKNNFMSNLEQRWDERRGQQ